MMSGYFHMPGARFSVGDVIHHNGKEKVDSRIDEALGGLEHLSILAEDPLTQWNKRGLSRNAAL